VSGKWELVRVVSVSTRDEARELESGRLACVDSAVPAEVSLCLLLTEATEGHLAFGSRMPVEDRLAARLGSTTERPVPPARFSRVGTRSVGVVHTNSGTRSAAAGRRFGSSTRRASSACSAWKGQRPPGGSRVCVAVVKPCGSTDSWG
jgi:hypothetical protein